jgi:hypothetical protein
MTAQSLLEILDALRNGVDPRTGEVFRKQESCLGDSTVRRALNNLIKNVAVPPEPVEVNIPDAVIKSSCTGLRELGYAPCVAQLAKVFIGSRSIADHAIKGLRGYNQYRGVYTRDVIHTHLMAYSRRHPDTLPEFPAVNKRTADQPWREIDFFRTDAFNKLEEAKYDELKRAVQALGLRKQDDRLPEYMARARATYPRAFEPWVRDEQALLIEAMCYTNNLDRLAALFARSAASVEKMGQRLIFESKEKQRA